MYQQNINLMQQLQHRPIGNTPFPNNFYYPSQITNSQYANQFGIPAPYAASLPPTYQISSQSPPTQHMLQLQT